MTAPDVSLLRGRPRGTARAGRPGVLGAALQSAPFLALVAAVLGIPFVLLLLYSFRNSTFLGVSPGYTLDHYREAVSTPSTRRLIVKSVLVGVVVSLVVTVLAFTIGYAVRFRMSRRAGLVALAIVLVTGIASFLVRVYAWGTILGTRGLVNLALEGLHITHGPLTVLFFGYFAIVVTMVYVYLPIATLMVYSAMSDIDPRTLEASRDLGLGRWRTMMRAVAPQARAGLNSAFFLTAVLAASDYITPSLVGGVRGQMVGSVVRDTVLSEGDYPGAAALSLVFIALLLVVVGGLIGLWAATRRLRSAAFRGGDAVAARLLHHVPGRLARTSFSRPAAVALIAYLTLPMAVVFVFSFNSANSLGLPWRGFTLRWYGHIVRTTGFTDALRTSVEVAVIAVAAAVVIGLPAAFALRSRRRWPARVTRVAVFLPFVIPGVMIGTAIITTAADRGVPLGIGPTVLVHILLAAPLVVLVVYARLVGMDRRIVEAARDLGSTAPRALRTVTLPLILPSVIGAALLAFAYSLDEIVVTTFTIGTGSTVPVWLFSQARTGFNPGINALGVMMTLGTFLIFGGLVLVLRWATRRQIGRAA